MPSLSSSTSAACQRARVLGKYAMVVVVMAALVVLCLVPAAHAQECMEGQACFPWSPSGPACRRDGRFNIRFMVDLAEENAWMQTSTVKNYVGVYGFCPRVDLLQSFTLNSAPFVASAYTVKDENDVESHRLTTSLGINYLSVYGFGDSNNTLYPPRGVSTGSVVIAQNGTVVCSNSRWVALVTTLVLDVGLHKGLFNYAGATSGGMQTIANPNYNPQICHGSSSSDTSTTPAALHIEGDGDAAAIAARLLAANAAAAADDSSSSSDAINYCDEFIEVYVEPNIMQPLKTGFVPTCTAGKDDTDYCLFDENAICIGNPGQKNCARCYDDATMVANQAMLQVWTSYYGTDVHGYTLKSGGNNPLNFRRFAGPSMFGDLSDKLKDLWAGNVSDAGLPVWPFD